MPFDDGMREAFSYDPLTSEEPVNERVAIDDVFAGFDMSLLDDLFAV